MTIDGKTAMRARNLRTDKTAQFSWSRMPTEEIARFARNLSEDLQAMLAVIIGDDTVDLAIESMMLPELSAWRCGSCRAPMITARPPRSVEKLDCPLCVSGKATAEARITAFQIDEAQARITRALAKEPAITRWTRAEVADATCELRKLQRLLEGRRNGPLPPWVDSERQS
jgi:hypothetical protein